MTDRSTTSRSGALGSLLVALGVAASVLPLRDLFEGRPWGPTMIATLSVVAVTGVVARWFGLPGWAVPLVQGGFLAGLLTAVFGNGTGLIGLVPGPGTFAAWRDLLLDARESIASSAPPAPSTIGVVFAVAAAAGAIALITDAIGVTGGQPALAGLPMVVPFLVSVANSSGGLPVYYVVLVALCWLALLAVVDDSRISRWTRGGAGRDAATSARTGRLSSAAITGVGALVAALVLAAALPITPNTILADRLGVSGGAGRVGFSPSPDMLSDLDNSNPTSVLRYTSDDPAAPPLRVAVSTRYRDGVWEPREVRESLSSGPTLAYPPGLTEAVARVNRTISVTDNRLAAPNLAAPELVSGGRVVGATWAMDPNTGVLAAGAMPPRYEMTYLTLQPTPEQLRAAPSGLAVIDDVDPVLDTSGISANTSRVAAQVTNDADTPYDQAVALQNWFRSEGGFTYSLDLEAPPAGMSNREAALTSVDRFLESKRGYCVQYSTAMTLMARSLGIPARLATGFLPGRVEGDARRVLSTDAHAWPELYFEGVGWLRFEPTPSVQSGPAPEYAPDTADSTTTPSPTPTPTATPTATPEAPTPTAAPEQQPEAGASGPSIPWGTVFAVLGLLVLAALLWLLFTLPARTAARERRNRLAAASTPSEGVLAVWAGFVDRLNDLGVRLDPARVLPLQAADLSRDLDLDAADEARLNRLVEAVQDARYAPVLVGVGAVADGAMTRSQVRERRSGAGNVAGPDAKMASDPIVAACLADARAVADAAAAKRPATTRFAAKTIPESGRRTLARRLRTHATRLRDALPKRES
ncbi:MAG: DUF3488 and transglutaminase-like domain-containing protein [Dermatophilus congolensis]|nr:DUF3488 and transglutaminase-like domain-containing protein [Dermatophilus congolensis]